MALFHNSAITGASGNQGGGAGGYQISRSLRFNSADSAYLSRTPASAGNRKTWTWAGWVKRSELGTNQALFSAPQGGGYPNTGIIFNSSNQLRFFASDASTNVFAERVTSAVYRDTSAWMHIVVAVDYANTQAKIYVNGSEVTAFTTSTGPTNTDGLINSSGTVHVIGQFTNVWYLNAYLADIHFIDGQALDPTSFTEFDDNGVLQPIAYAGSYGTNGFYLDFADNSTAAALGTDTSGNGNTWTVNNLSVTTGAGNDSLVDTPTSYGTDTGAGGEVRGNYATLNPLSNNASQTTLSNGNLQAVGGAGAPSSRANSTVAVSSGKWYFEATFAVSGTNGGYSSVGVGKNFIITQEPGQDADSYAYLVGIGQKYNNSSLVSYGSSLSVGDVFMCAFDLDNSKVFFGKNGTWFDSGSPSAGTNPAYTLSSGTYCPIARPYASAGTSQLDCNFGQRPFAYTAPSGFKALCTTNLPEPVVAKPNEVMDVKLYTGNGSTQTISGLNFSPDLVWFKSRSTGGAGYNNIVFDAVRGASKSLSTDITSVEYTGTDLTSFNSDGFTLAAPNQWYGVNTNATTFVAWTWDAGSSTVTNTAGSITSQVRANASAGFSVVTFTGNGTQNATVGHGLGVAPTLHIIKNRSSSSNWVALTTSINGSLDYAYLNSTAAFGNAAQNAPTSSVFSVWNDTDSNANGSNYVAYCWTPVAGYSSFGSYIGNGSADGPFVYTGFRPRWLMIKRADNSPGAWTIIDTSRDPYNVSQNRLRANDFAGEDGIYFRADLVSNGFKLRDNDQEWNLSERYIYAAFAESPFQYARAR